MKKTVYEKPWNLDTERDWQILRANFVQDNGENSSVVKRLDRLRSHYKEVAP